MPAWEIAVVSRATPMIRTSSRSVAITCLDLSHGFIVVSTSCCHRCCYCCCRVTRSKEVLFKSACGWHKSCHLPCMINAPVVNFRFLSLSIVVMGGVCARLREVKAPTTGSDQTQSPHTLFGNSEKPSWRLTIFRLYLDRVINVNKAIHADRQYYATLTSDYCLCKAGPVHAVYIESTSAIDDRQLAV